MKFIDFSFDRSVFSSVGYYQRNPPTGAHCCLSFSFRGKTGEAFFLADSGFFLGCNHCGGESVLHYNGSRSCAVGEYKYCPECFFSLFEEEALRIYQWLMSDDCDDWRFPPGGHKVEDEAVQAFMVFVRENRFGLFELFYHHSERDAYDVSLEEMVKALHSKDQGDDGDSLDESGTCETPVEKVVNPKDGVGRDLPILRTHESIFDFSGAGQQRSFDEALARILQRGPK